MHYISTRGAEAVDFRTVLLSGLAPDGGLYVPEKWPQFTLEEFKSWRGLSYAALAFKIIQPFVAGSIPNHDLERMIADAYGTFSTPDVTPLHKLSGDLYILELFHGPTLAFKDVALQLLGRLFDDVLKEQNERAVIVGATSGDTGSAAIYSVKDSDRATIFMLHPENRISEVQRRQMSSVLSDNVFNIAVRGTFDDCQTIVKTLFGDKDFVQQLGQKNLRLSAVNSINWARIMAQCVYYAYAALQLGAPEQTLRFCVPTGNFGNIYAAYVCRQMGLPIGDLVIATNRNDIVSRFFTEGKMEKRSVQPSLSNAMDIQVSSNFERFLFDLLGRDAEKTRAVMQAFSSTGQYAPDPALHTQAQAIFTSASVSDDDTLAMMKETYAKYHYITDPHTAVGLCAAEKIPAPGNTITISLACAAPAKFPEAVERALSLTPPLPTPFADLYQREERLFVLDSDVNAVREFVLKQAR